MKIETILGGIAIVVLIVIFGWGFISEEGGGGTFVEESFGGPVEVAQPTPSATLEEARKNYARNASIVSTRVSNYINLGYVIEETFEKGPDNLVISRTAIKDGNDNLVETLDLVIPANKGQMLELLNSQKARLQGDLVKLQSQIDVINRF